MLCGLQKATDPIPVFDHPLQSTPAKPDDSPKPVQGQQKKEFAEFLKLLGLTNKFPRKLKISDAMIIRRETLGNTTETEDGSVLPHLILQKLMMCDSRSRGSLFKGKISGSSALADLEELHPLDVILAVLHCSDNFLSQDLLIKLATCQLAIPFLLPNPHNGNIIYLIWAMRAIIRAWKSYDTRGMVVPNECRVVDYPGPVVSFFKIGELQQSKSKIINEVISESKLDFFFHWDCEGGTTNRLFIDGMAELCCYLPSGKNDVNSFYSDILLFANLRGDARKHVKQTDFIQQISFMTFVLLTQSSIDNDAVELLHKLKNSPGGMALMFSDLKNNEKFKNPKIEQMLTGMLIIKLKGKNYAQIRSEIRKEMVAKLQTKARSHCRSLSSCVDSARAIGIQIDEDDTGCKDGRKLADNVMEKVTSISAHEAKLKMLPLQGPDLWHKWAVYDKESYRQLGRGLACNVDVYNSDMDKKKKALRQNQYHFTEKTTVAMKAFLNGLLSHTGNVRLYFLCWLRMLLDDYSRKVLPGLHVAYQETRANLLKAKAANKTQSNDTEAILLLKEELKKQNEQLVNASFGLEHFFREMGQMYEARMDIQLKTVPKNQKNEVAPYPLVVAELMREGYPVELMDGDASHVPITWVTAVINKLKELYMQKQKLFVISVLGIQSTGKSTLLNTIFGLHFNVSAGRCTRGAYFQLLPVDPTLGRQIGTDHIMIVDTEGLRAPELQYKEAQKHDNELATFVIGLADLTIINIYGETPGELTDILQTAVHAFIRMKKVEMQLSCHFVHQNVTAVMADRKSKVGRQNFQDRLDFMTSTAAKVEKCESQYRSFQDVIQFDDENNVTMFPSLWKGDPPMAPVNPGYSFKAGSLKQAVVTAIQSKEMKCSFGNFQLRVQRLWSAVLQEKFVFSFKNTLEVTAYNELDTKYGQWSWDLQHKMLEWQHQTGNEIRSCEASKIDAIVASCLAKVEQEINIIYLRISDEMVEFFETSERSETLAQWRKSTEVRLKNLCDEHKDEARKHCKLLKRNREGRVQIDNMQQSYRKTLQAQIIRLASEAKKESFYFESREAIFNSQWGKWLKDISEKTQSVTYTSDKSVELGIFNVLHDQYTSHGHLVMEKVQRKPICARGPLRLDIEHSHLDSTRFLSNMSKSIKNIGSRIGVTGPAGYAYVTEEDIRLAKNQTNDIFNEVEGWVDKTMEIFQDFNKSLISDLLRKLQKAIEKFNNKKANFTFTPEYEVDMSLTVAGYAYKRFVKKLNQLQKENDPIEAMNRLKPVFFRTFETQLSEASNDKTAVHNLCSILRKSIERALIEKLQIEIVGAMKLQSSHFRKKNYFKVLVLKDLAEAKDFGLYTTYLSNIAGSLKYWSKVYVERYCSKKEDQENPNLYRLAKINLNYIISEITSAIQHLFSQYSNENPGINDTASSISDKDMDTSDDYTQHLKLNEWLERFHEDVKKTIAVDLLEITDIVGVESILNLTFFTRQLIKCLQDEAETILAEYSNVNSMVSKLMDSERSPHNVMYNSLIGCKEQCPFCKEQCELTDENHLDSGKPHYTEIHRPQCLGRYTYLENKKLVLDLCTKNVNPEGNYTFRNADTNNKFHPYKDYKKLYPNWLISTESPQAGPKYWEWFIATYNTEIVKWAEAVPTSVKAEGWNDITQEDAIDNLSKTYGLMTETD